MKTSGPLSSFPELLSSAHKHPKKVPTLILSKKKKEVKNYRSEREGVKTKRKLECKKRRWRRSEACRREEEEWGNIFHFPFPSSLCQGINRCPLEPTPSLCRATGGKWRSTTVYY